MSAQYLIARYVMEGVTPAMVVVDRVTFTEPVKSPTAELKRLAQLYRETPEGQEFPYGSFGWGDLCDVPAAFWEKHGVSFEPCVVEADLVVDNDAVIAE